mmetsp:Transcript_20127/g.57685  ORF Transcript_20127/g.57685 Transcript_20127/m.57685 type:complete len:242 (+) Transcript_20127:191-916(+)
MPGRVNSPSMPSSASEFLSMSRHALPSVLIAFSSSCPGSQHSLSFIHPKVVVLQPVCQREERVEAFGQRLLLERRLHLLGDASADLVSVARVEHGEAAGRLAAGAEVVGLLERLGTRLCDQDVAQLQDLLRRVLWLLVRLALVVGATAVDAHNEHGADALVLLLLRLEALEVVVLRDSVPVFCFFCATALCAPPLCFFSLFCVGGMGALLSRALSRRLSRRCRTEPSCRKIGKGVSRHSMR